MNLARLDLEFSLASSRTDSSFISSHSHSVEAMVARPKRTRPTGTHGSSGNDGKLSCRASEVHRSRFRNQEPGRSGQGVVEPGGGFTNFTSSAHADFCAWSFLRGLNEKRTKESKSVTAVYLYTPPSVQIQSEMESLEFSFIRTPIELLNKSVHHRHKILEKELTAVLTQASFLFFDFSSAADG